MKLKVLIILFNAILLTIFFTVFSFSFVTAGTEFIGNFLKNYWVFIILFLCLLAAVNIFLVYNWKIITALESEDWTKLLVYLETEVFEKKHLTFKKVRLFSEISILLGDFENLDRLEAVLAEYRPHYVNRLATYFAAAKLLSNDYVGLANLSGKLVMKPANLSPWIKFYNAFAEQMINNYAIAANKFSILLKTERHPLIRLLSLYFIACGLDSYLSINSDEVKNYIETEKEKLKKHSLTYWKKHSLKEKRNLHVLVLTRVIDEAIMWLF